MTEPGVDGPAYCGPLETFQSALSAAELLFLLEHPMTLTDSLREYIAAAFSGIWVESHEHDDALAEVARLCSQENWRLATWDLENGLCIAGASADESQKTSDPLAAIRSVNALATEKGSALLVLVNFHRFLPSAEIVQALAR